MSDALDVNKLLQGLLGGSLQGLPSGRQVTVNVNNNGAPALGAGRQGYAAPTLGLMSQVQTPSLVQRRTPFGDPYYILRFVFPPSWGSNKKILEERTALLLREVFPDAVMMRSRVGRLAPNVLAGWAYFGRPADRLKGPPVEQWGKLMRDALLLESGES